MRRPVRLRRRPPSSFLFIPRGPRAPHAPGARGMRVLIALPWTSFLRQSIHPIVPWHGPKAGSEGNLSRLAACSSRRRLATIPPPRGPYQDGEEQQDEAPKQVNQIDRATGGGGGGQSGETSVAP